MSYAFQFLSIVVFLIFNPVSSLRSDDVVNNRILQDIITYANEFDLENVVIILEKNPEFITYTNGLSCTLICELAQLFDNWHPNFYDAAPHVRLIEMALEYGARPNSSASALDLMAAANRSILGGVDEAQLPISSGECRPERDLLVPLAHRVATLAFDYSSWATNTDADVYSGATHYISLVCHRIVTCGVHYEAASANLTSNLSSVLSVEDRAVLLGLALGNIINQECLLHYID